MKKIVSIFTSILMLTIWSNTFGQNPNDMKPIGEMVDIEGYQLHFNVKGKGNMTVVIEAGAGSSTLHWLDFQNELANHFTVVTYDRGGYGWSDSSPYSRTANIMVSELHEGLSKLKIKGPYILLGHSFGGLLVKAFANKYPEKTKGIILAEAATEHQFEKLPQMVSMILEGGKSQFKQAGMMARKGQLPPQAIPIDSTLNSTYWKAYQHNFSKASFYESMYNEMDLLTTTYAHSKFDKPIDKPILVITAENSFEAYAKIPNLPVNESNKVWLALQKDLLRISSNSKHKIIKGATHDLLLTAPTEFGEIVIDFINGLEN